MLDNFAKRTVDMKNPVISIISAVYNVAAYLPEYLASLDAQTVPEGSFEVILVSDGSPDESEDLITEWMSKSRVRATLLRKENGGQASARNLGLTSASGDWVTFCDPDDYLSPDYLVELFKNMELNKGNPPSMYATRLVSFLEATGEFSHQHPLKRRFRDGNRVVNLDRSPDFFHMHGPTAIVKRRKAEEISLKFEEQLRFSFEDAHYVATYLLAHESPTIGYVTTADYIYRVRAAGNSSVQTGGSKPEKYTDVLKFGHLNLLAQCESSKRPAPKWLQFMLLYDIFWYFRGDRRIGAPSRNLASAVTDQFHAHISRIMEGISEESVQDFEIMPTDGELRNALLLGYKYPNYRSSSVSVIEVDSSRGMTRLEYLFSGNLPEERIRFRGLDKTALVAKSQAVNFLGKTLFSVRHVWIPSNGTFSVVIDGNTLPLVFGRPKRPIRTLRPIIVERQLSVRQKFSQNPALEIRGIRSKNPLKRLIGQLAMGGYQFKLSIKSRLPKRPNENQRLREFVCSARNQLKFQNAWVLMDRVDAANDNAEHLYRYIADKKKSVNVWFVLERTSVDWNRLAAEGFKLVAYGSREHYAALCNAHVYASSHLDKFVTDPLPSALKALSKWKFVFLQHGVTLHDQSVWFNSKSIDLLLTATKAEFESIVSDESSYRFTTREVALTGFPRHDAVANAKAANTSKPTMIIVSPTWRSSLLTKADLTGNRDILPEFENSAYADGLKSILSDEAFVSEITKMGYELGYLPHPMFAKATAELNLHPDVSILDWAAQPFSKLVGRAAVWITDYSSTAFEAAYANVPVVYFQFDADQVAAGSHIYDSGYFSFSEDGFGPVVQNSGEVLAGITAVHEGQGQDLFQQRRLDAFAFGDSNNSDRVVRQIENLFRTMPASSMLATPKSKQS